MRYPDGKGSAGFTLIEVTVAMVVATIVLGGVLAFARLVSGATRTIHGNLQSLVSTVDLLAALRPELAGCQLLSISADGTSVTYSLPVPAGENGAYVDGAGQVFWGVEDGHGVTLGGTVTLSIQAKRVIQESEAGHDLDGDGDLLDTFDVVELTRSTSTGRTTPLPPLPLLLLHDDHQADLDHDGKPDPIFQVLPDRNEIVLELAPYTADAPFRLEVAHCAFAARGL